MLSRSSDTKSQNRTKFSRFRLRENPGKWPHFQESPESCHLLFHRVLLIQNHWKDKIPGPRTRWNRRWHDSGDSWKMTSFPGIALSRNRENLVQLCDFISREHDRAGGGTILTILGNDIALQEQSKRFLEMKSFSRNTSCSITFSWYKIGKSNKKFSRNLENSNVIVYPRLCPPPILLPYHFRELE